MDRGTRLLDTGAQMNLRHPLKGNGGQELHRLEPALGGGARQQVKVHHQAAVAVLQHLSDELRHDATA